MSEKTKGRINKIVDEYTYTTTNHVTSFKEQFKVISDENDEFEEALENYESSPTIENKKHMVSELNDCITALIKYNQMLCEEHGLNLHNELNEHYIKDAERGYFTSK